MKNVIPISHIAEKIMEELREEAINDTITKRLGDRAGDRIDYNLEFDEDYVLNNANWVYKAIRDRIEKLANDSMDLTIQIPIAEEIANQENLGTIQTAVTRLIKEWKSVAEQIITETVIEHMEAAVLGIMDNKAVITDLDYTTGEDGEEVGESGFLLNHEDHGKFKITVTKL